MTSYTWDSALYWHVETLSWSHYFMGGPIKHVWHRHFLLKCMYQARGLRSQSYTCMLEVYIFSLYVESRVFKFIIYDPLHRKLNVNWAPWSKQATPLVLFLVYGGVLTHIVLFLFVYLSSTLVVCTQCWLSILDCLFGLSTVSLLTKHIITWVTHFL